MALAATKTISFAALQRCRTTIEDFAHSYMPLHGLAPGEGLFRFLDVLLFVEATIYQMDEDNEALCEAMAAASDAGGPSSSCGDGEQQEEQHTAQGHAVLLQVLEQQHLLSERVRQELEVGQEYWCSERRVCAHLARTRPGHVPTLGLADVLATHEAKSFDYRVLHLLLHGLLAKPLDEPLLAFMHVDEMLIDIGDDLTDYEDDVMANSSNIYRGFIHLFGRDAPGKLIERISQLEAQRSRLLGQLPAGTQALVLQRQHEAATEEGADRWVFPDPILDEPAFRREVRVAEAGEAATAARRLCASPGGGAGLDGGGPDAASEEAWWRALSQLVALLEASGAPYMLTGASAAAVQGADVAGLEHTAEVQWDALGGLHASWLSQPGLSGVGPLEAVPCGRRFSLQLGAGLPARVACQLNTVLACSPHRVAASSSRLHGPVWCQSLLEVRRSSPLLAAAATARLRQLQDELTAANAEAWSQDAAGAAWHAKVGSPAEAAARLAQDPALRLGPHLVRALPASLAGLRLVNLMGSHGSKAVAAVLLGARAACVDISPVNLAYGRQLARAAGAEVEFIQADVLRLLEQRPQLAGCFDVALLELGVLHYFVDLLPLAHTVAGLLAPGGRFVLHEFHPVSTKLISSKGKKHKVTGDYFAAELAAVDVAYSKYASSGGGGGPAAEQPVAGGSCGAGARHGQGQQQQQQQQRPPPRVLLRQWSLGEVVTAFASAGLVVCSLEESPGTKSADAGLPKLFTLVCRQPGAS